MTVVTPPIGNATEERLALTATFLRQLFGLKRKMHVAVVADSQEATDHQLSALMLAEHTSGGMTMNELSKAMGCATSTATALVDRLIKQGLAERQPDPEDRRVVRIRPTSAASPMIARARVAKLELGLELLAPLTDKELTQLVTLMSRVINPQGVEHA